MIAKAAVLACKKVAQIQAGDKSLAANRGAGGISIF